MAAEAHAGGGRRRRLRWILATSVLAFAVWHAVFDITLDRAMKAYVEGQARYAQGAGPALSIRAVMADARRRGALLGLPAAAGVALVSVLLARLTAVRRRRG